MLFLDSAMTHMSLFVHVTHTELPDHSRMVKITFNNNVDIQLTEAMAIDFMSELDGVAAKRISPTHREFPCRVGEFTSGALTIDRCDDGTLAVDVLDTTYCTVPFKLNFSADDALTLAAELRAHTAWDCI